MKNNNDRVLGKLSAIFFEFGLNPAQGISWKSDVP